VIESCNFCAFGQAAGAPTTGIEYLVYQKYLVVPCLVSSIN